MNDVATLNDTPDFETPIIETFENKIPWDRSLTSRMINPRFITKCPITGNEDYSSISITYKPNKTIMEHRSLRRYMESFRDLHISHEAVLCRILDDIVECCKPYTLEVESNCEVCEGTTSHVGVSYEDRFEQIEKVVRNRQKEVGSNE